MDEEGNVWVEGDWNRYRSFVGTETGEAGGVSGDCCVCLKDIGGVEGVGEVGRALSAGVIDDGCDREKEDRAVGKAEMEARVRQARGALVSAFEVEEEEVKEDFWRAEDEIRAIEGKGGMNWKRACEVEKKGE